MTSPTTLVRWSDVIIEYGAWHNRTLHDGTVECRDKKVLVWRSNAGLGDSVGAVTSAFVKALQTGRLFFIDWQPHEWRQTLEALPFSFEYGRVVAMRREADNSPLICPSGADSFVRGHMTFDHPLVRDGSAGHVNKVEMEAGDLTRGMFQPSPRVRRVIDDVIGDDAEKRQMSVVIRTGVGEYNQFLTPGDEEIFISCAIARMKNERRPERWMAVVASDAAEVKRRVAEALKGEFGRVVALDDSIAHVSDSSASDRRVLMTYVEYFLLARADVFFLTHGSLFGRSASERRSRSRDSREVHVISDSQCDGVREKYSYLRCNHPKIPPVCLT